MKTVYTGWRSTAQLAACYGNRIFIGLMMSSCLLLAAMQPIPSPLPYSTLLALIILNAFLALSQIAIPRHVYRLRHIVAGYIVIVFISQLCSSSPHYPTWLPQWILLPGQVPRVWQCLYSSFALLAIYSAAPPAHTIGRQRILAAWAVFFMCVISCAGYRARAASMYEPYSYGPVSQWVGKEFPLFRYIDSDEPLDRGTHVLLFYSTMCNSCVVEVPLYERMTERIVSRGTACSVVGIQVPPYVGQPLLSDNSPIQKVKLSPGYSPPFLVPVAFMLVDGEVKKVSVGVSSRAMSEQI